jgi:hypothetical protein
MSLCAFPPRTDDVNTLCKEGIKSLVGGIRKTAILAESSFQLSKELLDGIQVWRVWRQKDQLYFGLKTSVLFGPSDKMVRCP